MENIKDTPAEILRVQLLEAALEIAETNARMQQVLDALWHKHVSKEDRERVSTAA